MTPLPPATTSDNSSPAGNVTTLPRRPVQRVKKACLPCRLTKVKCSGDEPCARCVKNGLMCVAGVDKVRPSKYKTKSSLAAAATALSSSRPVPPSTTRATEPVGSREEVNLFSQEVHSSIVGSDASVSSHMHLCYGPSSNFVFLRHLYRALCDAFEQNQSSRASSSDQDSLQAIREMGYTNVFFGTEDNQDPVITAGQETDFTAIYKPESLTFELAATFLEMYISTLHLLFPFCAGATLRRLMYSFYANRDTRPPNSRDDTLLLAVLAIGATLTEQSLWAESLFQHARNAINSWGDSVSLRSVQILILLAEYQHVRGRPNSTYLTIGAAVYKALAAGLHHDIPMGNLPAPESTEEFSRERERNATFWVLYAQERIWSLPLGRPPLINDLDVDVPEPASNDHLKAVVAMSRISHMIYYKVYRQKPGSLAAFFKTIKDIKEKLDDFHRNLSPELQFPLSEAELQSWDKPLTVIQLILAFNFAQNTFSYLRPCLIIDAARIKSLRNGSSRKLQIPPEWAKWLQDIISFFREININTIRLFARGCDTTPISSRLRHSRFFVETACFILLYDVVHDPYGPDVDRSLQAVEDGIQGFLRIPVDKLLLTVTQATTRMLNLTKEIVARARGLTSSSPSTSGSPFASTSPIAGDLGSQVPHTPAPTSQHSHTNAQATDLDPVAAPVTAFGPPLSDLNQLPVGSVNSEDIFNNSMLDMNSYLWLGDGTSLQFSSSDMSDV